MNKQEQLAKQLGSHMSESTGGTLVADDRFEGFLPNNTAGGDMPLDRIMEDKDQPRKTFDEEALKHLAENIKSHGVQQAIQVRWSDKDGKWLIVYGHRRYRASKMAGLQTVPCTFMNDDIEESTIRVRQLVENCQREDLAPLEMAHAIDSLAKLTEWSNRRIGEELGFSHVSIGRYRDLLKLPDDLRQRVADGILSPSVAVDVLRIKDQNQQSKIGRDITQKKLNRHEAKQVINEAISPSSVAQKVKPKEKELLMQNTNITIYRNPDANDAKIQKELLTAAAMLDPEKTET